MSDPTRPGRLEGKVAFVTGAARGQGRAHAVRLAAEGADIIAVDVCKPIERLHYPLATEDDFHATQRLVEEQGRRFMGQVIDVREGEGLNAFVTDAVGQLRRLDIVVANAGVLRGGRLWETDPEDFELMLSVNVTGVWNTIRAAVPPMLEFGNGGSIVLVSSVAGLRGLPFYGAYAASKHAVVGMCRTLANELGEYDIRVNTIHPAGVATGMTGRNQPEIADLMERYQHTLAPIFMNSLPYERMEPEDVAGAVAWLASDDAKYVTGAQIPMDFGTLTR